MTNNRAKSVLHSLKDYYNDKREDSYVGFDNEDNEALDMAIGALEDREAREEYEKWEDEYSDIESLMEEIEERIDEHLNSGSEVENK